MDEDVTWQLHVIAELANHALIIQLTSLQHMFDSH